MFLFLISLILISMPVIMEAKSTDNQYIPARYVVIVDSILAEMAEKLSERHHLCVVGEMGGLAGGVNILGLSFQSLGPQTKEQLRTILVDCVEDFLSAINENTELRPRLKHFPFTSKEIKIELFVIDNQGRSIDYPNIGIAKASRGKLEYITIDSSSNPFEYKSLVKEDYSEALRVVKSNS